MDKKRFGLLAVFSLVQNANFKGFFTGKIYQGSLKNVCVPGLNCYSCPGAVGACPIGSLQGFLSGLKFRVPYYIVGLLLFFGAVLGRAVQVRFVLKTQLGSSGADPLDRLVAFGKEHSDIFTIK